MEKKWEPEELSQLCARSVIQREAVRDPHRAGWALTGCIGHSIMRWTWLSVSIFREA